MNKHAAPEFAMSFTPDAVLLERREGHDWRPLGRAPFAGGNMASRLQALCDIPADEAGASGDDPDTLLVIPDDQILYTRLTVSPGGDLPAIIGRALEGMTPYKAEELAFDWCPDVDGKIDSLRVAVVARRTLDEAEDFARGQGFRPTGFTARPGDDRFDGQPDFGLSRLALQQPATQPFSMPDLRQAAITSDRIEIDEPAETPAPGPVISRILPHVPPVLPQVARIAETVEAETTEAGPVTEEAAPMVETPQATVAAPVVIRHGDAGHDSPAKPLPARAKAVHARAAEARARRAQPEEEVMAASGLLARLRDFKPGTLGVMMGLLVLALLATLVFFGSKPAPQQITEATPTAEPAPVAEAAPEDQPEPAPLETTEAASAEEPAPAPVDQQAAADQQAVPVAPDAGELAEASTAPEAAPEATPEAPATEAQAIPQDALTTALAEAMAGAANAPAEDQPAASQPAAPATGEGEAARIAAAQPTERSVTPEPAAPAATTPAAPRATAGAAPHAQALNRSARPPRATPARTQQPAAPDTRPAVPANPLPYAQRNQAEPPRVTGARPPSRPAAARVTPASAPATPPKAVQPAPATTPSARPVQSSPRPPLRPDSLTQLEEGSASEDQAPTRLTEAERRGLEQFLRDLRTAETGTRGLSSAERGAVILLAQARPQRKPLSIAGPSQKAVSDALAQAMDSPARPEARGGGSGGTTSLARSARPTSRPGSATASGPAPGGGGNASLSRGAVESAIAAAVESSSALPGAVALTALSSSALPPRRSSGGGNSAPAAPTAPTADDLRAAAAAQAADQAREAALAEQRRQDAELQAQAEARARARAAADAQAEAQARAAAEARARAQAEAEARAASQRRQRYTPPEAENEPEIASQIPEGRTAPTVAAAATVKDGIQISRTQIIGTVGAGKASRALVRLSNGRIITLRLGDKINGGTITDIGDSRITFVKGGRQQQLSVLNGQ